MASVLFAARYFREDRAKLILNLAFPAGSLLTISKGIASYNNATTTVTNTVPG
jgi:hypothetical protein